MGSLAEEVLCDVDRRVAVLRLATALSLANDVLWMDCDFVFGLLGLVGDVFFW